MPADDGLRIREATRAVVLTPDRQVLLVRFEFPTGSRWALPGGGIDPGESTVEALQRELLEEVGLVMAPIGPHIWERLHIIPFLNGMFDGQREQIHLVEVPVAFEPQPAMTWEQLNAEYVFELRWWSIDEIRSADDVRFAPSDLGNLLHDLTESGPPRAVITIDV